MKLVGLMLVRNEDWVLRASLHAALRWCDEVVVLDHASTDDTRDVVNLTRLTAVADLTGAWFAVDDRIHYHHEPDGSTWNEMDLRQRLLEYGRERKATHFALIDADEIICANTISHVRGWAESLKPGYVLDVALHPIWRGLETYRQDESVWSSALVPLVVADRPDLAWRPKDGYQFHNRRPQGSETLRVESKRTMGVMHLQFANRRRIVAKHAWYKMTETVKWPGRRTPQDLNVQYGEAIIEPKSMRLTVIPDEWGWWKGHHPEWINLYGVPWHVEDCKRMWQEHGAAKFKDLELWGVVP